MIVFGLFRRLTCSLHASRTSQRLSAAPYFIPLYLQNTSSPTWLQALFEVGVATFNAFPTAWLFGELSIRPPHF